MLNSEQEDAKLGRTSRRQWLSAIAGMFGIGIGAAALARFMRSDVPSYAQTRGLGNIDAFVRRGAQRTINSNGSVLVVVRPEVDPPYAMLMECTHSGCPLALKNNKILCGCHGGVFDLAGRPVSGPPKKPLTRVPLWVQDNLLYVRVGVGRKS